MRSKLSYLLIFIAFVELSLAQNSTDEALGMQFYNNKEYDKAVVYLEKMFQKNPIAYYPYYYKSLIQLKDFNKAEKTVKRQMKYAPEDLKLFIDLAEIFKAQNDSKKEIEQYEKAIKEINSEDLGQVLELGKAFQSTAQYDYALQTFMKGRKASRETYPFFYEIAEVYKEKGDVKSMINEYLDALEFRDSELATVQMHLQSNLGYDEEKSGFNHPVLKQELLKRIQSKPEKTIFSEFMLWITLQQKDYEGAFAQSKALDKREKGNGARMMELGRICMNNTEYDAAEKAYEYVLTKGKDNVMYDLALIESVNARFEKLQSSVTYSIEEITQLDQRLNEIILLFGKSSLTLQAIRKQAQLKAYFLHDFTAAIQKLDSALLIPGLDSKAIAETKLDLGDLQVIAGDRWEGSLLYSQVEKTFKYDLIGQEAKFRNAKVAFYSGDFKWAKAQLDVLKGATTKLIANDAMDLSLIISDAIGIDTNTIPLWMFAQAELLQRQNKIQASLIMLDSINKLFDNHSLGDEIYYRKGLIFLQEKKIKEANEAFQRVYDVYPDEIYGDDALFKLAEIQHLYLNDAEKAKLLYQEILTRYPSSIYSVEARKRFRKLRGDANIN
jgi:tetratricopeptide (TPR) repeat protein